MRSRLLPEPKNPEQIIVTLVIGKLNMTNWTIGKRLAAASFGAVAIVVVLGIVSWAKTNQISKNVDQIINVSLPDLTIAGDIRYRAALLRVTNFKFVMYNDAGKRDDLEKQV